jgi:hypothetical protein
LRFGGLKQMINEMGKLEGKIRNKRKISKQTKKV